MIKPKNTGSIKELISAARILNIVSICIFVFGIIAIFLGGVIYNMGKNSAGLDKDLVAEYNSISQQGYSVAEVTDENGEPAAEGETGEITRTYTRTNRGTDVQSNAESGSRTAGAALRNTDATELAGYIATVGKIIIGFGILCIIMSLAGFAAAKGRFGLPAFIVGLIITVLVAVVFFVLTDKFTFIYLLLYFIYTLCCGSIALKKIKQAA